MVVLHFYRTPGISAGGLASKLQDLKEVVSAIDSLDSELCFNVEVSGQIPEKDLEVLKWLLSSPFNQNSLTINTNLSASEKSLLIEIGPRLNFSTAFSSNALSMCRSVGITCISRLEVSTRYLLKLKCKNENIDSFKCRIIDILHDRMTQMVYEKPIESFDHGIVPENWFVVDILKGGRKALEEVNDKLGLAFDDWDLDYYTSLFLEKLKRNPTSVECFDLAQSNSEHSRHWFFKGKMFLNGIEQPESLMKMILKTQEFTNPNNVIKFSDNSSAIKGQELSKLRASKIAEPAPYGLHRNLTHLTFTAETHNFPTGVAPFSGATTGTGGRLRDVEAVGRGGHCIAGTAGYSVGNLLMPGYLQPWEDPTTLYPDNLARPLTILIEASNGASDYGNKFGEPLISGFTRSFGMKDCNGERKEWVKPIMFSGGVGALEGNMVHKMAPEVGMKLVKIGGPVYRIGVGGGSASSVQVQGDNKSELDFGAVQRGDPEMENKLNRVIRGCIEDPTGNPICSIHDQGAGGNGNVLKELVEPAGAVVFTKLFSLGDSSLSTLEVWGAEYQESNAILLKEADLNNLMRLSHRERCPVDVVGTVTGNGKVILSEETSISERKYVDGSYQQEKICHPFNLDLELVLGKMPQKSFHLDDKPIILKELTLPSNLLVTEALNRVLRLATVCSKRFLTNKVDRCVTGLVAQQQCVGPLHTPLADCAVTAVSMFEVAGVATAIGEQPIKGLLSPEAGARLSVAEALSNLVFARISQLEDVKCSGNWMWAAKLPGEGALLYRACKAMCQVMEELGVAVDGGKDSLSMAARVEDRSVISPGTLVVSTYAPCPDVRVKVTPDLKSPALGKAGVLLWISTSNQSRLGGSALAQCFNQLGNQVPDLDSPSTFKKSFKITQSLISENKILSGHDISDGGFITCILEMAFGGLCGLQLRVNTRNEPLETLFSEEVGWVLEVPMEDFDYVVGKFDDGGVPCSYIGQAVGSGPQARITLRDSDERVLLDSSLLDLLMIWEETSYRLELRQANPACVRQEFLSLESRTGPSYSVTFDPDRKPTPMRSLPSPPRVAVVREEGINGDREMAASLFMAGFEVWDVTVQDFLDEKTTTDLFRGIIFPGGFSYADVLGSAKGWAACLLFNDKLRKQFSAFAERTDTFSLGVCNGCQLMGLLGWIGSGSNEDLKSPEIVLDHNDSERFECRWSTVAVGKSPAVMLRGMEGSLLGVWVAHGEGRFTFRDEALFASLSTSCVPLRYTDDSGQPTEVYPMNPNGSRAGVAGVCSPDGRHLAVMPHPERCTMLWQWPYVSPSLSHLQVSPWMRIFDNAYVWAQENSETH